MDYIIDSQLDGLTVLDFLKRADGISRTLCKRLKFIPDGILLNGEKVTVRAKLHTGDRLSLAVEDTEPSQNLSPVDIPLDIIFEDEDIVLPNKPCFMPTHPSHDHYDDTVANALAFRYKESSTPFVFRPVNRLDRNTSGLVLIAKNRIAASKLSSALKEGRISKTYISLLDGHLAEDEGDIETYIRRCGDSIIVRENCDADGGGDYALTKFRVICRGGGHTLVFATPVTGRTHQLRVHFSGLGCAISGDDLYGGGQELIARHALHAYSLSFPLPSTDEEITLHAPLHEDMREAISSAFGDICSSCLELQEILKRK